MCFGRYEDDFIHGKKTKRRPEAARCCPWIKLQDLIFQVSRYVDQAVHKIDLSLRRSREAVEVQVNALAEKVTSVQMRWLVFSVRAKTLSILFCSGFSRGAELFYRILARVSSVAEVTVNGAER